MSWFNFLFKPVFSGNSASETHKTFILEPILTPSGIVDSLDDGIDFEGDGQENTVENTELELDDPSIENISGNTLEDGNLVPEIPDEDLEEIPFIYASEKETAGDPEQESLEPTSTEENSGLILDSETELDRETTQEPVDSVKVENASVLAVDAETEVDGESADELSPLGQTEEVLAPAKFDSGYFVVGETGEVGVDYLFDGGGYKGELGIFSLGGMEEYDPDTEEFIAEAARRSHSNSELGHIIISDRTEGARFSGELGEADQNSGEYLGVKTFNMNSGDRFGMMLVPKGRVEQVVDNPGIGGAARPLFSLSTANPEDGFHWGQIVDVTGEGNTFVFEDLRVDGKSDGDYNDLIFQVRNATGKARLLDEVIDSEQDWRNSDLGQTLIEYTKPYLVVEESGEIELEPITLEPNKLEGKPWEDQVLEDLQDNHPVIRVQLQESESEGLTDKQKEVLAQVKDQGVITVISTAEGTENLAPMVAEIQENFDNVLVVGRGEQEDSDVPLAKGVVAVNDSQLGDDLDVVVLGEDGTVANQNAAQVVAEVWDANPDLSYQQVIETVKVTATDLQESGELINPEAAIHLARSTVGELKVELPENQAPENLVIAGDRFYNAEESIHVFGQVTDGDTAPDLAKVVFSVKQEGEEWRVWDEISAFDVDADAPNTGHFNHNLAGLSPGKYQLKVEAFDYQGAVSNTEIQSFTVLSEESELTDRGRWAIAEAVNLDNYDPEYLNNTRQWVVSLPPDIDSEALAQQLGVTHLGETGSTTNSYIWEFPLGTSPQEVAAQLAEVEGVEYAYPLVEVPLEFYPSHQEAIWQSLRETMEPTPVTPSVSEMWRLLPSGRNDEIFSDVMANGTQWNEAISDIWRLLPGGGNDETLPHVMASGTQWNEAISDIWQLLPGGGNDETLPHVMANGTQWNEAISDIWRLLPGGRNDETLPDVMANGTQWNEAISKFFVRTLSGEYGEQSAQALQGYFEQNFSQSEIALEWYGGRGNPSLGGVPHTKSPQVGGASVPPSPSVPQSEETLIHYLTNQLIHRIGEEPQILLDLLSFYQRPEGVDPLEYPNLNPHDPDVINLLNSYQWHLRSDENPDADANISQVNQQENLQGRDVVIGVIDNGFEVTDTERSLVGHADLSANYREDLSYDFDEEDSIPSRVVSSEAVYQGENRTLGDWGANSMFGFRSPHSGLIQNATLNLDIEYESVEDLEIYLYWHEKSETSPLPVEKRLKIKSIGEDLTEVDLTSHLRGQPASTLWGLEIIDTNYVSGKTGTLNDWSLDLDTVNAHGTAVVGVSSGDANNNLGVNGVAGSSGWAGLRVGGNGTHDLEMTRALRHNHDEIDVYNNSWGLGFFNNPFLLAPVALEVGAQDGRDGFGNIYVFAGGNAGKAGGNVNYNAFANSRHTIAVAAIDHEGKQSVYSESGAALLVSAYSDNGTKDNYVGITTTGPYADDGDDTNDYLRGTFGGTSSATPLVSGVVALMLEANPNLTARDVQHILVETAQKNDPDDEDWVLNGAGRWVNHKYGFGAVDALAAVEMAKDWTTVADEVHIFKGKTVDKRIEDNPNSELTSTLMLDTSNPINVEWLEVEFKAHHEYKGDLEIILEHTYIDDFGEQKVTQSVLSEQHFNGQYLGDDDFYNWRFTSARHWGEPSRGEWQLKVRDKNTGNDSALNEWDSWKLNLYGVPPVYKIGDEFLINNYTQDEQSYASVDKIGDHGFVTIWKSFRQEENNYGVYARRYDDQGVPFENEFRFDPNSNSGIFAQDWDYNPSVVGLNDGRFVVSSIYNDDLPDTVTQDFQTSVAQLNNGDVIMTWEYNRGEPYEVYGNYYDDQLVLINRDFKINTYSQNDQLHTAVAALADGGFVVTWSSENQDGSGYGIYGQRYASGAIPVGTEFQVNTYTQNSQDLSHVTGLVGGGFVVTWSSENQDGSGYGIYGQRYNSEGFPVGTEFQVNTYTQNDQYNSSVTGLSDGGFIVIWQSDGQDGSNYGIYGQRYNSEGIPIGVEFQVNTHTQNNQENASITELSDGKFVVTWQSDGQDGSGLGVYGQRFGTSG